MLKTYDTTLQTYTEHLPKNHDATLNAWVDSQSAKTYDTSLNAWVERLYADYFVVNYKQIESADSFTVSTNEITLFTSDSRADRRIQFELPFEWNQDTVEYDLTTNGVVYVYFGKEWTAESGKSVSGYDSMISESYNGKVTIPLGTIPTEIEGSPVVSSKIYIYIGVNSVGEMGYATLSNLKISGRKYGFKE